MQNNGHLGYFQWFWAIILHTLGVQAVITKQAGTRMLLVGSEMHFSESLGTPTTGTSRVYVLGHPATIPPSGSVGTTEQGPTGVAPHPTPCLSQLGGEGPGRPMRHLTTRASYRGLTKFLESQWLIIIGYFKQILVYFGV